MTLIFQNNFITTQLADGAITQANIYSCTEQQPDANISESPCPVHILYPPVSEMCIFLTNGIVCC